MANYPLSWWQPFEVFVLASFAFAQPLLSVLGASAAFLVAHHVEGIVVVWYALALVLGPAAVLMSLDLAASSVGPRVGHVVHASILGILLGLTIAPPLNRVLSLEGFLSLLVLVAIAALGIFLVLRLDASVTVVRFASVAPVVFLGFFLFASPASVLITSHDPTAHAVDVPSPVPVVWVVFDQLPLAMMVDSSGDIDEDRFPNFVRLAGTSTWYRNATTVAGATDAAVPSALSGRYSAYGKLPLAVEFPTNIFTLLASSHEIRAHEAITRLCPRSICGSGWDAGEGRKTLWADTTTVLVRSLLADDLADFFVPETNDRWAGFNDETSPSETGNSQLLMGDDRVGFEAFLDELETAQVPRFYYMHQLKPHEPLVFLPDGRIYDYCSCFYTISDGRWPKEPEMMDQRMQQYLMQTMHVDGELGEILDRLEETGLMDDALVVVMSDHGASMVPGNHNRIVGPETYTDLLPVPLFVKMPGQWRGRIDHRNAQLTDIVPTLLDAMGVDDLDLGFDGASLLASEKLHDPVFVISSTGLLEVDPAPQVTDSPMIRMIERLFPEPSDPFKFGPNAQLVGTASERLVIGPSQLSAKLATARRFQDVDLSANYSPSHVIGELSGLDVPVEIAVSFNGTIAGVGSTFRKEFWRISIMGDPKYLVDGSNQLTLYQIVDSGLLTIAIE